MFTNFFKQKILHKQESELDHPMVMDKALASDYNALREIKNRSSFCYAPTSNMYFSQNGEVKVCCHNTEYTIGKYPQQTIHEIWNSPEAITLREHMKKFDLNHGCSYCAFEMELRNFTQSPSRHFDKFSREQHYPSMMEFLLTNTCNLECVMCTGEYSSSIRKNREKLAPLVSPYNKNFVEQLKEFIPSLREARFSGSGEAFSIDLNFEIWEQIIALNPQCVITIQSNGTYLNSRIKDILNRGRFEIGISLDSLNHKTFESIRVNAKFDRVMENIQYFSKYCKRTSNRFSIATCIMRNNWHELPDFVKFCNSMDAYATFHKVWFPEEFALNNLSFDELQYTYTTLANVEFTCNTKLEEWNANHYRYFVGVIKKWLEMKEISDAEQQYVYTLKTDDLMSYLHKKTTTYYNSVFENEASQVNAVNFFISKFSELLQLFPAQTEKEMILRNASAQPSKDLVSSFEKFSVDFLYQEIQKRGLAKK
jgi:radical SAM protein with 4Fe4S-binding SPASM domain